MNAQPFTWNHIPYRSIREAARAIDKHEATLRNYRKRGYTCDGDVRPRRTGPYHFNDKTYQTLREAAEAEGYSISHMRKLILATRSKNEGNTDDSKTNCK